MLYLLEWTRESYYNEIVSVYFCSYNVVQLLVTVCILHHMHNHIH